MKRRILLIFLFLVFCVSVAANPVNFREARTIAQNWTEILRIHFRENITIEAGTGRAIIKEERTVAYVFSFKPTGFVIIAARDYLPPVKFYTTTFDFDQHDRAVKFQDIVFGNLEKIIKEVDRQKFDLDRSFGVENREFVKFLRGYHKFLQARPAAQTQEVEPLIKSTWSQTGAFNLLMPGFNGIRAPAGCVAVAAGQIMKYHEWPPRYNWGYMKNVYFYENDGTPEQLEAISTLMYDIGLSVQMGYYPGFATANSENCALNFPEDFNYSDEIEYIRRFGYTERQWFGIVKKQIDEGLPVSFGLSGSPDGGHQVVIDGYRIYGDVSTVHINFGWGGGSDGYYSLSNVLDYESLDSQCLIINMKPPNYRRINPVDKVECMAFEERSWLIRQYKLSIAWECDNDEEVEFVVYRKPKNGEEYQKEILTKITNGECVFSITTSGLDFLNYEYKIVAYDNYGNFSKNQEWFRPKKENF